MNLKRYYVMTGLMALMLSPLVAAIVFLGAILIVPSVLVGLLAPLLALVLVWALYAKKAAWPEKASELFTPIVVVFCYYMGVWIVVFGLSGYRFYSSLFERVYFILTSPYFVINFFLSIGGDFGLFPVVHAAITAITIAAVAITCKIIKKKMVYDKKTMIHGFLLIGLSGIAAFQHYDKSTKILARDYEAEQVKDEVNLYEYRPFHPSEEAGDRRNSKLKQLGGPPAISFTENYPRLDGATAAYPVYSAMAQELYQGLDETTVAQYVSCSKTDEAYGRLINGEIDVFFGAQPSKQQTEAIKEKGLGFTLTPIAKEAFVFLANKENPVGSLALGQIQDIYQKKIVNWRDVGGNNETIMPFQRPENSGSQTIMLAMVMGDKTLPAPLWEEYSTGMGGVISKVAEYRNYSSAIGYSFRYFANGMKPNDNIKLLAIDGIEPTVENIRNGTYPFTIDVYAVTVGPINENTEKLIEWVLSDQGQGFIEACGYVRK